MRIGELAARTGVSVRSLRYYEEQGLLTSLRSPSGHRRYSEGQVERILLIQRLFSAGLSSRTIVDLLPCVDAPSADASEAALERMRQERHRLDVHIEDLVKTRAVLDELIAANRAYRSELASA
ncbi:MerR family transcriptional regulator [Micromonospora sp. WMMD1102]|uniref:MerR family transcriptional regulator n=1 Tax=Micromonospora sp. WMMD1102 TaxID=3016105 RepID=UPI0024152B45|nr:MerR family transcriptional regulator [Micromonospora sp. WMMD1102]MDG4787749.1 MerR family transcriptional regulator [Micromonospora sp. WMMD1102]